MKKMASSALNRVAAGQISHKALTRLARKNPKLVRRGLRRLGIMMLPLRKQIKHGKLGLGFNVQSMVAKGSTARNHSARTLKRARRRYGTKAVRDKMLNKSYNLYKRGTNTLRRGTAINMATVKRGNDTMDFNLASAHSSISRATSLLGRSNNPTLFQRAMNIVQRIRSSARRRRR